MTVGFPLSSETSPLKILFGKREFLREQPFIQDITTISI